MQSVYFDTGENIILRVPPKNPLCGMWIKDKDDLFPKGFTHDTLLDAMHKVCQTT